MITRRIVLALIAITVVACTQTLPPTRMAVVNLAGLAGTYTGTMNEASELNRSTRLVLQPDGTFELVVGDPKGFRTGGTMVLMSDGTLRYEYNEMRGQGIVAKGTGVVYEGDGRRAIVLEQSDGSTKTTVARDLP